MKGFHRVGALMAKRKCVIYEDLLRGRVVQASRPPTRGERANTSSAWPSRRENEAIFSVPSQFRASITGFTDAQADLFTKCVAQSDDSIATASVAFAAAFPISPPIRRARFRKAMSGGENWRSFSCWRQGE